MPQLREVIGLCGIAIIAIVAASATDASAKRKRVKPIASIDIRVKAGSGVTDWQRSAMQTTLRRDIATDKRWTVIAEGSETRADMVLTVSLEQDRVDYIVTIPSAPDRGSVAASHISIRGKSRQQLRNDVLNALSSLLQPNGAAQYVARYKLDMPPGAITVDGDTGALNKVGITIVLLALGLFLIVPFVAGAVLVGAADWKHLRGLRALRTTFLIWGGLAATAIATVAGLWPSTYWPAYIPAGIAWGWFVSTLAQMTFPPFRGLERVEHRDVFRLLRAWSFVAMQRLVTGALLYGPFMLAVWWTCAALNVPPHVVITIVVPLVGLTIRFWFLSLVETLSTLLDARLVDGEASEANPWAVAVRGYFVGYLNRAGAQMPEELLARIQFLPGEGKDIKLYGGGLTHSRIVIGKELLEFALAPYDRPHDYAPEREHKLLFNEWTSGLVIPIDGDSPIATHEDRAPRDELDGGEIEHEPLGQPPTLAGYVEPSAIDHRLAYRPSEDPVWLDWDPGEEHDGTDPNDKDFLFGALVREIGLIERRDDHMLTIAHAFTFWLGAGKTTLTKLWRWLRRPHELVLARYPALLADAYAVLNYGRNHLVQHLAWRVWRSDNHLSARAYPPELERHSKTIFAELASEEPEAAAQTNLHRRRLVWMSWFSHERLRSQRTVVARRIAYAGVALAVFIGVAVGVKRAIDYHPTYVKRIEAQEKAINNSTNDTNGNANGEQRKENSPR